MSERRSAHQRAQVRSPRSEWREELTPEQYEVLRQAGTEPPFTGEYIYNKASGHVPLRGLRGRAVQLRHQVRLGHRLAELHRAGRRRGRRAAPRQQPVHASHRGALPPLRWPSGPRLRRRSRARPGSATASTRPRCPSRPARRPPRRSRERSRRPAEPGRRLDGHDHGGPVPAAVRAAALGTARGP